MAIATVNPSTGQLIKLFESLNGAEIEAEATARHLLEIGHDGC